MFEIRTNVLFAPAFTLALVVGQATGVLFLGVGTVMIVGTLIWIVDGILIYLSVRNFKRSALIAKL